MIPAVQMVAVIRNVSMYLVRKKSYKKRLLETKNYFF